MDEHTATELAQELEQVMEAPAPEPEPVPAPEPVPVEVPMPEEHVEEIPGAIHAHRRLVYVQSDRGF